jgi:hypothetical protein
MHCLSCDCLLSDDEVRRKNLVSGEYLDMCTHCLKTIQDDLIISDYEEESDEEEYDEEEPSTS